MKYARQPVLWRISRRSRASPHLQPIVALVAGILILVIPRLLNIIVAAYLILVGLLGIGLFR
jgi:Protein of unknown function (DUF3096)